MLAGPPLVNNNTVYSSTDYHVQRHGISEGAFRLIARYRAEKFQPLVRPDAEVLEFGCGPGWNLVGLSARRRVGYDVTDQYAEQLRNNGVEFTPELESLAGQQFDFILLSHVFEHLVEPARALIGLKAFLRPGGTLFLIVPFDRPGTTYDPGHNNHHLYMWDVQSLTELLMACGFRVEKCGIGPYGFDRLAATYAARWRLGYRGYRTIMQMMRTLRPGREIRAQLTLAG